MRHLFFFPLTPKQIWGQNERRGVDHVLFIASSPYQHLAKKLSLCVLICFSFFPLAPEASEALRTPADHNTIAKGKTLFVKQVRDGNGKLFANALGDLQGA